MTDQKIIIKKETVAQAVKNIDSVYAEFEAASKEFSDASIRYLNASLASYGSMRFTSLSELWWHSGEPRAGGRRSYYAVSRSVAIFRESYATGLRIARLHQNEFIEVGGREADFFSDYAGDYMDTFRELLSQMKMATEFANDMAIRVEKRIKARDDAGPFADQGVSLDAVADQGEEFRPEKHQPGYGENWFCYFFAFFAVAVLATVLFKVFVNGW